MDERSLPKSTGQGALILNEVLRRFLVCPGCRNELRWNIDDVTCAYCSTAYDIIDGIPILLPSTEPAPDSQLKAAQAEFFGREDEAAFEADRPHGAPALYGWLLEEKFRRSLVGVPSNQVGDVAVTVCGGSGMDAEFLSRQGFTVVSTDLSLGAARNAKARAEKYGLRLIPVVADVECLPFRDHEIPLVYVHDGLHHLIDPYLGLKEMMRIASHTISVTEPAAAAATAVAVKLGVSDEVEEAGNRVARLYFSEIRKTVASSGFTIKHEDRYAMYYKHEPGWIFRLLSPDSVLPISVSAWRLANSVLGRIGNKLTFTAVRTP
jgi:ubiquinone/menaquinone biosynthesis C-methylase UbiE/uncharacterized protein YbaR (Trm112 family)